MKQNGLFCFILVILFIEASLIIASFNNFQLKELGEAKNLLLQQEKVSFVRTEIEQNIDILIERMMRREIKQRDIDSEIIKWKLKKELSALFDDFEFIYKREPAVNFYSAVLFYKKINPSLFRRSGEKRITEDYLGKQFNVLVINIKEKIFLVEFNYSGGVMRNRITYALIESNDFEQIFLIPVGYSRKIVEVVI